MQDTFTHGGTRDYLFQYYGLDEAAILANAEKLLGREFTKRARQEAHVGQQHNEAVAEGL